MVYLVLVGLRYDTTLEAEVKLETTDPVKAIDYYIMCKDENHWTAIKIKGE